MKVYRQGMGSNSRAIVGTVAGVVVIATGISDAGIKALRTTATRRHLSTR